MKYIGWETGSWQWKKNSLIGTGVKMNWWSSLKSISKEGKCWCYMTFGSLDSIWIVQEMILQCETRIQSSSWCKQTNNNQINACQGFFQINPAPPLTSKPHPSSHNKRRSCEKKTKKQTNMLRQVSRANWGGVSLNSSLISQPSNVVIAKNLTVAASKNAHLPTSPHVKIYKFPFPAVS